MNCNLTNWNPFCEKIVNDQINIEFWASYQYHLMWSYFDRSEVGLKKIAEFFKKSSDEEREHAHKLMKYQNMRGGKVVLNNIKNISLDYLNTENAGNDVIASFKKALDMEQIVYKHLLQVHKAADDGKDPQFTDFIEGEYLGEQVEALNEISKYISQLQRIGEDGHGIWNFDQEFSS